jgi:hypothetical protein
VRLKHGREVDVTWNPPQVVFWGGADITTGTACVCLPELGLLFNRANRQAAKHPSRSNQCAARDGAARSQKHTEDLSRSIQRSTHTDIELGRINPYIELDEKHEYHQNLSDMSSPSFYEPPPIPSNAVHVRYDFHVDTDYSA